MMRPTASRGYFRIPLFLLELLVLMSHGIVCARVESVSPASEYLASTHESEELQRFLDDTVKKLMAKDPSLRRANLHVALMDLNDGGTPLLAHWNGKSVVYPASVVKFVYLMAAYAWQEQGKLNIDKQLDRTLHQMIYYSNNRATQQVVASLTGTKRGPELSPAEYQRFRDQRLSVKRWLESLGIKDLHTVHPTYNGGDISGREMQFLTDDTFEGGLKSRDGIFRNRQAMTAVDTAKLLALLATDRALSPENSRTVRQRMRRDPKKQPYLTYRLAGGAKRVPGFEVYSKTGTWGPIFADAGILRHKSGRHLALAVFIDKRPAYRGRFIADLAHASAQYLAGRAKTEPPKGGESP